MDVNSVVKIPNFSGVTFTLEVGTTRLPLCLDQVGQRKAGSTPCNKMEDHGGDLSFIREVGISLLGS